MVYFAIDKGYRPVNAAGGYPIYYLWFNAEEEGRTLKPYDDPDHKWLYTLD
jgi:5-deoxy-glucuronate isomerase